MKSPTNNSEFFDFPSSKNMFEFSTSSSQSDSMTHDDSIIFCGKVISTKTEAADFQNPKDFYNSSTKRPISSSPSYVAHSPVAQSFRSNSSRKHKVMIGLARIPSTIDLADLKERQSRRAPPPMFPAGVSCGEEMAVIGGNESGRKTNRWGLFRPFRCSRTQKNLVAL
ncbi:hypothetical protein M5689_001664 [Euphorbia peplus]|nr:hypothetical protein M5689_001664 [Euphorbia peplus]